MPFAASQGPAVTEPPRLLVVEDEAIVALDLVQQLGELGYCVCATADNADDALSLAGTHAPDLVLMDVVIKGARDGITAADELARSSTAPIIFLTAFNDSRTVERAARTGAYGYVTKPFNARELRAAIEVALHKRRSEEKFRAAFDFAPAGMALVALDGSFLQGNGALHTLLRCRHDELQRLHMADFTLAEDAQNDAQRQQELLTSKAPFIQFERRFRALDGKVFWALVSVSMLHSHEPTGCLLYQIHDLTEQRAAQEGLLYRAQHDELTGLCNRAHLRETLGSWIQASARHGTGFAVVYADLDRFKEANDRYGHAVGDEVLRRVARRLTGALRSTDRVARLGGDEFVALIADVREHQDVVNAVQKMVACVSEPLLIDGRTVSVGLSAGACLYPADAADVDTLLQHADHALYRAKAAGRGQLRFFDERVQLEMDRDEGAARSLLTAFGAGAVQARWHTASWFDAARASYAELTPHWEGGAPDQACGTALLEFAYAHGLGGQLAEAMERGWVLHHQAGPAFNSAPQRVGLHVDMRLWRHRAAADRLQALLASEARPGRAASVVLVINARHLAAASPEALHLLAEFRNRGLRLALREFDAQAPSMDMLLRWTPEFLTLGGHLLAGERAGSRQTKIICALLSMARCLGTDVLADGPLSPSWRWWLKDQGCAGMIELVQKPAWASLYRVQPTP